MAIGSVFRHEPDKEGTMDEENKKDRWKSFTEEVEIAGQNLVDEVTRLIAEGNVRKLKIHSQHGDISLEVPLSAGAVIGGVVVLTAPWLALLGALAGLLARVRIEVVRTKPEDDKDEDQESA